ncbi:MAG: protein arginine kinase [Candidatus Eisenbacteria bacterium]|nr:protein arginine kinase [Candidatus Eisenbacteria bacterium]
MTTLDELVNGTCSWLSGEGPECVTVLSTRVRLARNLKGYPFTHKARQDQLSVIIASVFSAASKTASLKKSLQIKMAEISNIDKRFLVERHLISPDLTGESKARGIVVSRDESLSAMVNEEDHIRIQSISSGFQVENTWHSASRLDDELSGRLEYAFNEEFGFLTSCPTNIGTGLRVSVLIHLPALVLTKKVREILEGLKQVGVAIRGFYGEGTDTLGYFFQISNQTTLGQSEHEIASNLGKVTKQVIDFEARAREVLIKDARIQIEDKVWRALGTLMFSRIINSQEVISLTSLVRLGLALEFKGLPSVKTLNEILVFMQPAHLQKAVDKEMESPERNVMRAEMIRKRLEQK